MTAGRRAVQHLLAPFWALDGLRGTVAAEGEVALPGGEAAPLPE